ncbi:hypothetical protein ACBQ24_07310 [Acinetobacter terrestris]|uniref:hypothetical protein n=1 Tax=Acinetobacter terrestris TaxID=2529843 RepID=UPI00352522AF
MSQKNHNDVKAVTQLIIAELLKRFSNSADFIKSLDTVADLFIQSVLKYNLFKENNFFTREIQIISEDEFLNSFLQIKQGDKSSLKCFTDYISHKESKKFQFEVPYEYITDYVYSNDLNIEDIVVEDRLNSLAQCISGKILNLDDSEIKTLEKVFRKFRRHLLLAIYQKKYIDEVTHKGAKEAESIADNARNIADIAKLVAYNAKTTANNSAELSKKVQEALTEAEYTVDRAQIGAEEALSISSRANEALNTIQKIAEKTESTAQHAQKLANEADAQAKSTIANYISILGIFASIIFTLFGGVNLIGSTVKLLEVNSRWPYLTFIIALLMICLLTLLNMMVKWITSMNNLKNTLDKMQKEEEKNTKKRHCCNPLSWDFYTKSVSCFLIILVISLGGMYKVNKENLFSLTKETTTKEMPKSEKKSDKQFDQLKPESQNRETTVVEKITLSNHANIKSSDKDNNE